MKKVLKALPFLAVVVTAILLPIALAHAVLPETRHLLTHKPLGLVHQILLLSLIGLFARPPIRNFINDTKRHT